MKSILLNSLSKAQSSTALAIIVLCVCSASPTPARQIQENPCAQFVTPIQTPVNYYDGTLSPSDCIGSTPGCYEDTYSLGVGGWGTSLDYEVTMIPQPIDAFLTNLIVRDASNAIVANAVLTADATNGIYAKATFSVPIGDNTTYRIEATSCLPGMTGDYNLHVQRYGRPLHADFEGTPAACGWTKKTVGGSRWRVEAIGTPTNHRFKTNVGQNVYKNETDTSLKSPTFSLAGTIYTHLTFETKYKTEAPYDKLTVSLSTDGGTTYVELETLSGTSANWPDWTTIDLDLSAYDATHNPDPSILPTTNCKIQFRFTSDTANQEWGVAIDDVVVRGVYHP